MSDKRSQNSIVIILLKHTCVMTCSIMNLYEDAVMSQANHVMIERRIEEN